MQTQVLQILQAPDYAQEILRGVDLLNSGKLLILPTETSYAVAGILTNSAARAALNEIRQSPAPKPFTLHVARPADAMQYLGEVNELGRRMMRKLWPGPIGLQFDVPESRRKEVSKRLDVPVEEIYDRETITLRCPDHPVFFDLVSQLSDPVALTAPPGGRQRVADIDPAILDRVDMVLDAGESRFSKPSTLVKGKEDSYEVVRDGVYDRRIIERLLKTTILFICSGNTCRSPMAETIARHFLAEKLGTTPEDLEKKGIFVTSAGAFALPGARATPQGVEALSGLGMDLSRHRSRPLTVELIHQADVIYAMGAGHVRAVTALVPSAADKTFPLDPDQDIEDPIGGDVDLYVDVAKLLQTLIEKRLAELVR
jgi:protein-tyrosine phosphatase